MKEKMKKNEFKFNWVCDYCGKVIESMYERQLENNKRIHMLTHEKIKEKGD